MTSKSDLPGALHRLCPDAAARLDVVNATAWRTVGGSVLGPVRARVAHLLGLPAEDAAPGDPRCVELAEQLLLDASGVTEAHRAELADEFPGERFADLVRALFAVEFALRLQRSADALLEPAGAVDDADAAAVPVLGMREALAAFQDAVVRANVLDPVVTELVRLRCARTHHCRICRTLRLADAREAGVDETMTAKIDDYEASDLPERAKVALRVTDGIITGTAPPSPQLVAQARERFDQRELASLCLDVVKWSTQKIHVALGTDGAERLTTGDTGVALFGFDADGRVAGFSPG